MTNLANLEGLFACILVFAISCVHVRRIRVLKRFVESKQYGPTSILHKASVIGIRLQLQIALLAAGLGFYILLR
jgi:hypothetical protein